jgi:hypothetical protein
VPLDTLPAAASPRRWLLLTLLTVAYGMGAFGMLGVSPLAPSLVDGFRLSRLDVAFIVHQVRPHAGVFTNFHQTLRIGAIHGTHHQQQLAVGSDGLDTHLPVLSCVTDILRRRSLNQREALLKALHDVCDLVEIGQVKRHVSADG